MQKIIDGIQAFQSKVFSKEVFEPLVHGQQPLALFITCSDSRIVPSLITQTAPGELFIMRNAGNIVPAYGTMHGGESATIEYAVSVLQVNDIVICGHSHCGAVTGLLDPDSIATLPAVRSWLSHAEATRRIIEENHPDLADPQARLLAAVETNVLVQLDNLRTHPCVAAGASRADLRLHGWVYHFETGQVFAYAPSEEKFVPLVGGSAREAIAS